MQGARFPHMTEYLPLFGPLIPSVVALYIAIKGWRKADQRAEEDRERVVRAEHAKQLAELLELHFAAVHAKNLTMNDAKMKAILLPLPGYLATLLRVRLELQYTMKDVQLDPASAARLEPQDANQAGSKWKILDRNSVLPKGTFNKYQLRPEWIEAELAYDIAGLLGDDQDAVLKALSKDVRDPKDAAVAMLQQGRDSIAPAEGASDEPDRKMLPGNAPTEPDKPVADGS